MGTGKISSNTITASEAISKLTGIDVSHSQNQQVTFSSSSVPAMLNGKKAANQVVADIAKLADCVLKQANKFPELAEAIVVRDQVDAQQIATN
jgi:molecular chaperone DnaK (HSP70)